MRFAAALEGSNATSKISSAEKAIEFFRDQCQQDPRETVEVSEKFLNIAEQLEKLFTDKRLKAVTKILHARLLATAIMLNEVLEKKDKSKLLKEWEKVTFRIFGLSKKDSRTKIGEYVNLAREIFKIKIVEEENSTEERLKFQDKEYTRDKILEEISQKITDLGKEYPVREVANNLREADCYSGWQDELVYFLYRYEEYLTKEDGVSISDKLWTQIWNSSPTKTIEHIYPQTDSNPAWHGKLGIDRADIEKHMHRLGNLIILPPGVNSKAGNKPFQEKKDIYKDNRGLKLLEEVIALNEWDIKTLEEREKKLIKFVEQEWG